MNFASSWGDKEVGGRGDRSKRWKASEATGKYFYRCKNFESWTVVARIPIINEASASFLLRRSFPAARLRKLFNKGANWGLILGGRNISRTILSLLKTFIPSFIFPRKFTYLPRRWNIFLFPPLFALSFKQCIFSSRGGEKTTFSSPLSEDLFSRDSKQLSNTLQHVERNMRNCRGKRKRSPYLRNACKYVSVACTM